MRSEVAGRTFRADGVYLDTATYGLPADTVVDAMVDGIDQWARGVARIADFDAAVARSRELFAQLVGVAPEAVAVANQASVHVGAVAAGLPDGSRVVVPAGEFTSLLFPLLVHARRGVIVEEVPLEELADRLHAGVDLVAFSIVQSSDGRIADVEAILEAARRHDVRTLADGTQAVGWLPVDAGRFDLLVVSAYKWLMCPRGTAFLTVGPRAEDVVLPVNAGWYAGEDVWASIYGGPLRLAASARRLDVSPAWLAWLGSAAALELVADLGVEAINAHDRALADDLRRRIGLPRSDSVIVSIPTDEVPDLAAHSIRSAVRAGSVRVGFHLYNDAHDVDALVSALATIGPGAGAEA
jgi:selenocysteine lyase/cysteine desulfurase